MGQLHVDHHDRVAVLTIDDPERRNALTQPVVDAIVETFNRLEADDSCGAVVLTGAPPAFCSGADTSSLGALAAGSGDERKSIVSVYDGFLRVRASSLPTVAAVNGPAVGAGFNLALACDIRLAGESARFDPKFLSIGIHPGGGHLWLLERLVGPQTASALTLFAESADGRRAVELGLAWSVHSDGELLDAAIAAAGRAAARPKELAARAKDTLRQAAWQPDFDTAVATEVAHQTWSMGQSFFRPKG
jgi:enoyl-CoA hydratase